MLAKYDHLLLKPKVNLFLNKMRSTKVKKHKKYNGKMCLCGSWESYGMLSCAVMLTSFMQVVMT